MARLKSNPTETPLLPISGVKAATFRLLLDTAMSIIQRTGNVPSVAEVALRSKVSRATAYRYFPSRSALVTAVIDSSLGPVRRLASDNPSGRERVHELFAQTFPRFKEFEPQMRAAAQLSLEQRALERAGLLQEEPYRRGHRVRILAHAIAPLAPLMRPAVHDRLHHALSIVYGIEPYVILKDIWGLPDRVVERTALWMADALIDAALRESGPLATRRAGKAVTAKPGGAGLVAAPTSVERRGAGHPSVRPPRVQGRQATPAWFDAQYDHRARITDSAAILAHWAAASAQARVQCRDLVERAYGPGPREKLDVFPARSPGSPVLVYLHGGYWRALDKRDQSFVAPAFVDAGALVVLPDHALCPAASIESIVLQLVQALAWVHRHAATYGGDPSHIVVAGHSSGGHLATMLLTCDWAAVAPDLPVDLVKAALSVSGIYDLEPLRHAPFLAAELELSAAAALRLSPAWMPAPRGTLVTVVGGDESEEFRRQSTLIAQRWGPRTVLAAEVVAQRNHMDVLRELSDRGSRTHGLCLQLLRLGRGDPD